MMDDAVKQFVSTIRNTRIRDLFVREMEYCDNMDQFFSLPKRRAHGSDWFKYIPHGLDKEWDTLDADVRVVIYLMANDRATEFELEYWSDFP